MLIWSAETKTHKNANLKLVIYKKKCPGGNINLHLLFFLMFEIESRALCTIRRCSAIGLYPYSDFIFYLVAVQNVL